MKDTDWRRIRDEKNAVRQRNAEKPFAEKLTQLDRLRERSAAIRGGRDVATVRGEASTGGTAAARRKK